MSLLINQSLSKKVFAIFFLCTLFFSQHLLAQDTARIITGTVVNSKNEPVAAAQIAVKGSDSKVTADDKGKFSLSVSGNVSAITISAKGEKTQDLALNAASSDYHITMEEVEEMNLLMLIWKGGWVMIPLAVLLILALFFAFERFFTIRRASKIDKNFMNQIRDNLMNGKVDSAISLCKNTNTPIARLLGKGLKRIGKPIKEVESAVESEGRLEIYKLEKNMNWLGIIAGIAPMLGFVGTISGVIKIFYSISVDGNISIASLSG